MIEAVSLAEFARLTTDPERVEALSVAADNACGAVLVDCRRATSRQIDRMKLPHCVIIGVNLSADAPAPDCIDVIAEDESACTHLLARIAAHPVAAATLADLLRQEAWRQVDTGLTLESLAYSALQHGQEFERWLSTRKPRRARTSLDPVLTERNDAHLLITLNQPERRNAFSAAMRDRLCESLGLALMDPTIRRIWLRGAGPAFCAGGDLDEFGSQRDASIAHAGRLSRSAGRLLHRLSARVTCVIQGACIGAGIELAAFSGRIEAHRDAFVELPEVGFGLIPGAGGTVSIPRRIGRLRTARLALGGERIGAAQALHWGLVDNIVK